MPAVRRRRPIDRRRRHSTTVVEPVTTGTGVNTGLVVANAGNVCPGAPLGCAFGLAPGTAGVCTGQFQQTTPAITAGGPFSFVAYRAIAVPGFDVFGRVPGMSVCHIRGNFSDSCTGSPNTGGR